MPLTPYLLQTHGNPVRVDCESQQLFDYEDRRPLLMKQSGTTTS